MRAWGLAVCIAVGACSPVFDDSNLPDEPPLEATLDSIAITPGAPTIKRVLAPKQQLTAIATYSDSVTVDVTEKVTWSSSDPTIAAVSAIGEVTAATAPGTATITATLDGVSGTATLTAADPTLVVASYTPPRIDFFSAFADGNVAPTRSIVGPNLAITNTFGTVVFDNEIYVADVSGSGINVYSLDATGDTAPLRRIAGPATKLGIVYGLAVTKNEIFVTGLAANVLVFPRLANGNIAPIREIVGGMTQRTGYAYQVTVHDNELYVAASGDNSVNIYPIDATGDVAPTRRIAGALTTLATPCSIGFHNDEIVVGGTNAVWVFAKGADGDVAPIRSFTKPNGITGTMLVLGEELIMPTYSGGDSVITHSAMATGTTPAPLRTLTGTLTNVNDPLGIWIY